MPVKNICSIKKKHSNFFDRNFQNVELKISHFAIFLKITIFVVLTQNDAILTVAQPRAKNGQKCMDKMHKIGFYGHLGARFGTRVDNGDI